MKTLTTIRTQIARLCDAFAADQRGATAIEYGIIAAGVGACVAASVYSLGSTIQETFYNKLTIIF